MRTASAALDPGFSLTAGRSSYAPDVQHRPDSCAEVFCIDRWRNRSGGMAAAQLAGCSLGPRAAAPEPGAAGAATSGTHAATSHEHPSRPLHPQREAVDDHLGPTGPVEVAVASCELLAQAPLYIGHRQRHTHGRPLAHALRHRSLLSRRRVWRIVRPVSVRPPRAKRASKANERAGASAPQSGS
jgi:hypothetical protein